MKKLYEIKQKIANESGYSDWLQMGRISPELCLEKVDEVAKLYANNILKKSTEKAQMLQSEDGEYGEFVPIMDIVSLIDKV